MLIRISSLSLLAAVLALAPARAAAQLEDGRGASPQRQTGATFIATLPPEPRDRQDPADSLYREARNALNRGSYSRAAFLFAEIRRLHPRSSHAADSFYWEAFAHYRTGSSGALSTALELLREQSERVPDAATRRDAEGLASRIRGQLARRGDAEAAREVTSLARELAGREPEVAGRGREVAGRGREVAERGREVAERSREAAQSRGSCRGEDDERLAALNALMQMDSERALPILKRVMARRDEGSLCLRRRAVFLISQHHGGEAEAMLLDAVRSDPDREVREQGVFWLSQVHSETAVAALDSVLRASPDRDIQEKAIFALSQHNSPVAQRALQEYARRASAPLPLREQAVFWLGQSGRGDNVQFLQTLFGTVREASLREKIIFSVAQHASREGARWLLQIAAASGEDLEIRKKAVFWAAQSGGVDLPELFALYDRAGDRELKEQLIFAYSQSSQRAARDKLVDIVRNETDRELRKKAMFWLTQTNDPRVPGLLAEIIDKP